VFTSINVLSRAFIVGHPLVR